MRLAAIEPIVFKALDEAVFFTNGSGVAMTMSFVSTGRLSRLFAEVKDEEGLWLSAGGYGWFSGWLEMLFTTRGRSWPDTDE